MAQVKRRHHAKKLTKKKYVTEPYEVPYQGPYGTHPLVHVGFFESRHLHPQRLPTPAGGERTVSLRLLDISKETVDNVQQLAGTLKRLQLCNLRLEKLPGCLVANLVHLRKLDLGENALVDNSFPETISDLENLLELRLNDNKLTKLPNCLKKLKNLSRIDISNNCLETVNGIEKLRKVQIIILDHNKLSSVIKEVSSLKRLEILSCSYNRIKDVPHEVRHLQSLSDIDISNNHITVLNPDIFKLPNLEALNASQNNINKLPSFNIQLHHKHWISVLDLSGNKLAKFPGHLLQLTHKLDLSNNKIKVLSWNAIKKVDTENEQELDVGDNPISYPPLSVCESGLKAVTKFFHEARVDAKTYQGIKILVLGSHRSGKSSLVQSLVDQQSRITRDSDEVSSGINVYETNFDYEIQEGCPGRQLQLCILDFCGNPFYNFPNYLFFEQTAITILTFNMAAYKEEHFYDKIGSWFDWMITKTNKLAVLLVATHCDLVSNDRIKSTCAMVCDQLKTHMDKGRKLIEDKIKKIEEEMFISPTLTEKLKSYTFLLRSKFSIQTNVIITSSAKYKGFDRLVNAIENLSNDRKLFPHVMRVIPTFWVEIETYLEERGNSMVVPILSWSEYTDEVTRKFGMKHLLRDITTYLHETGKVIWFGNNKTLTNFVFLRPSWLFDVLRQVYRYDASETIVYDNEDSFKIANISQTKFDRMKHDLLYEGILDADLFKGMLVPYLHNDKNLNSTTQQVLKVLVEGFEIGYPVIKRPREDAPILSVGVENEAETNEKPQKKMVQYLIPWLRNTEQSEESKSKWKDISDRRGLAIHFMFPRYMPPGIFHLVCVRLHKEEFKLKFVDHWKDGLHAVYNEHPIRIVVNVDSMETSSSCLKMILRDDSQDGQEEVPKSTMWTIVLPLLTEIDDILKDYTGVLVERYVECPFCQQPSFPGEWATPKETQSMVYKKCEHCGENVDTGELVQPKTKTRDSILLSIRRRKAMRKNAAIIGDNDHIVTQRTLRTHIKPRASVPDLATSSNIPQIPRRRRKSHNDFMILKT